MEARESIWPSAREIADTVEPGMVVGLGTGRAAAMFVRALATRVREGLSITGVATSLATAELAGELEIPLASFDEVRSIEIDVDGADEVDPSLDLIKGHGGALLRERVVASVASRFIVLVGEEKLVPRLGARKAVPVEVVPFAAPVVRRRLEEMGARVELREQDGVPFESDNGNFILDARFDPVGNAEALEKGIDALPGVVDNGLFVGMADVVWVQGDDGFRTMGRG